MVNRRWRCVPILSSSSVSDLLGYPHSHDPPFLPFLLSFLRQGHLSRGAKVYLFLYVSGPVPTDCTYHKDVIRWM